MPTSRVRRSGRVVGLFSSALECGLIRLHLFNGTRQSPKHRRTCFRTDEFQSRRAEADRVSGFDYGIPGDFAVKFDSVRAAEITDFPLIAYQDEFGVLSGGFEIGKDNVAIFAATDDRGCAADDVGRPEVRPLNDLQAGPFGGLPGNIGMFEFKRRAHFYPELVPSLYAINT